MPLNPGVTAATVEAQLADRAGKQVSTNGAASLVRQRRMPSTLPLIQQAAAANTYHVFNVGPWPQRVGAGSYGFYDVPPCPFDREYVECRRDFPGIITEYVPKDEHEYNPLMSDGWLVACEIVGDGRGRAPAQSLRHYGLFPSRTEIPAEEDLAAARQMLTTRCEDIVREARDLHAIDPRLFQQIVSRGRHWKAAEYLNLDDEPWMTQQTPTKRVSCVFCGAKNDDIAVKCSNCHEIINVVRYKELKEAQELAMAAPKRSPGRPPKEVSE